MCGIVGVVSVEPVRKGRLDAALDSLHTRGPDGRGVWWSEDGTVGLGHTRLAINDPANGHQPLVDPSWVCAVNGEFYGLEHGDESDSTILPRLCHQIGFEESLTHLRGEFALAAYHQASKTLYLARDRFGIKPLVWARIGPEFWFASKARALWAAGLPSGWSEHGFWRASATQYPPMEGSLFRGVQALAPACWMQLGPDGLQQKQYWRVPSIRHGSDEFKAALGESVRLRLRPDHPTAIQLSGGVDSASVLGLASQEPSQLSAFSIDFSGEVHPEFSEGELARSFSRELQGVDHTVIELSSLQVLEGIAPAAQAAEGLFVNGHGVAKYHLNGAIRKAGIKVVLSGEGADELLFGYRHFQPHFPNQPTTNPLEDPAGLGIMTTLHTEALPMVRERLGFEPGFFASKLALGRRIRSFLKDDFVSGFPQRDPFLELVEETPLEHLGAPLEKARALWLNSALRGYILEVLGDGCEMAHSVEGRPPFLDHKLWEMALPAPSEAGAKTPLRSAVAGVVPDAIRLKPKHPFMAPPVGPGLNRALRERLEQPHPFVDRAKSLAQLDAIASLTGPEAWQWEPPMLWLLSSYALQEVWP